MRLQKYKPDSLKPASKIWPYIWLQNFTWIEPSIGRKTWQISIRDKISESHGLGRRWRLGPRLRQRSGQRFPFCFEYSYETDDSHQFSDEIVENDFAYFIVENYEWSCKKVKEVLKWREWKHLWTTVYFLVLRYISVRYKPTYERVCFVKCRITTELYCATQEILS